MLANSTSRIAYALLTEFSTKTREKLSSEFACKLGKQPQVATNTSIIAKFIAEETGAEIVELQTQKPYPTDSYSRLTQIAKDEQNKKARPALKNNIDISDYDSRIAMQCFPSFTP